MLTIASLVTDNGTVSYILALTYGIVVVGGWWAAVEARRDRLKARRVDCRQPLSIGDFFYGSVAFASTVRFLSFVTLSSLSFLTPPSSSSTASSTPSASPSVFPGSGHEEEERVDFFSRSIGILFNMGDFVTLSSFFLLAIAWTTANYEARAHLYSPFEAQRCAWVVFLSLNSLLLLGQMGLYLWLLLAAPATEETVLTSIYGVLAFLNLSTAPIVFLGWTILRTCVFAGFPLLHTTAATRVKRLGYILLLWTVGRIAWGANTILAADEQWKQSISSSPWVFGIVIATFFIVAEVVPFVTVLAIGSKRLFGDGLPDQDEEDNAQDPIGRLLALGGDFVQPLLRSVRPTQQEQTQETPMLL